MTTDVVTEAPASFVQERMFTEEHLFDTRTIYTVGSGLRLSGTLDPERLRAAMSEVTRRHEILRTSFRLRHDELVQAIHPAASPDLAVHDLRHDPAESRVEQARTIIRQAQDRPFPLERPPLWRAVLFVFTDDESWLVLTLHHAVIDGWALARVWRDLGQAYDHPDAPFADVAPPPRYADHARWERERDDAALRRSLAYWRDRLGDPAPPLNLPFDRALGADPSYRGAHYRFRLPAELAQTLRRECARRRTTPFVVLLATYGALLHRYTDQADLRIGVPLANRMRPETRELVGPLINFLPLCLTVDDETTFDQLVEESRAATLGALEHQEVPLNSLVRHLLGREQAGQPLFRAVFTVQPPPEPATWFAGIPAAPLELPSAESARADVDLMFIDDGDAFQGVFQYRTEGFDRSTVERMAANFQQLLAAALGDGGHRRVHELPLLSPDEQRKVREIWSKGGPSEPGVLHHLVDRAGRERPAARAVTGADGHTLRYAELVALANRVAHALRRYGAGPDRLVALCAPRDVYTPVFMLAVLKAGAGYLILDPDHPDERNRWTIEDAQPVLLVTGRDTSAFAGSTPTVPLASLLSSAAQLPDDAPPVLVDPANLAYVVYTSGSTGRPKGVAITHAGITNLVRAGQPVAAQPGDVTVVHAAMTFDGSIVETWMALANGAELIVAPSGRLDLADYRTLARQVSYMQFTPGLFNVLAEEARADLEAVPQVLLGGDRVDPVPVAAARGRPGTRTLTSYGPTECSVIATTGDALLRTATGRVPIGRAVAGIETYVLDRHMRPVPIGVPGELYLGGIGLARGYLRRPGPTAERFVPDPFADRPGARLYRTGDRVRWLPDGSLDFLGRFDDQVKIRGFRIEPGEIATVLSEHPLVSRAVVLVRTDDGAAPTLVGYVVPARPDDRREGALVAAVDAELLAHCRARLPEYMVPRHLVAIETVPLTGNGKVDRLALPVPRRPAGPPVGNPERTAAEAALTKIWTEVLDVPAIGLDEDFFDAGGDSLAALRVVAAAGEQGLNLSVQSLYQLGTIRACIAESELEPSSGSGGIAERTEV